jgi:DNA primase
MISRSTIDRVFESARIEQVVGDYVVLKKRGSNMLGLCPFHNEKTPSFTVTPTKGIYKCFGCGAAGNAVGFLMAHDQLTYPEAIRQLAARYQIEIEEDQRSGQDPSYQAEKSQRDRLWDLMAFAHQYYTRLLWDHASGIAIGLSYFRERGLSDATIHRFGLGYSLEQSAALVEMATQSGYTHEELELAGLALSGEHRGHYDRFRGRVLFPIYHLSGKVIGFGGRTLKTDRKEAKYINSPETPLYRKSESLFGLHQARKAMTAARFVYLVEGYMDVISLSQAGIENVVASSGTALTREQATMVHRFADEVTLIYDGDQAGIKAALRGIDLLLENDLRVRVIALPEDEDPDTLAKRLQGDALKDFLITNAQDFMAFQQKLLLKEAGRDPLRISSALQVIAASIACVQDPILRAMYIRHLAEDAGIPDASVQEAVVQQFKLKARRNPSLVAGSSSSGGSTSTSAESPRGQADPHHQIPDYSSRSGIRDHAEPVVSAGLHPMSDIPQETEILRLLLLVGDQIMEGPTRDSATTLLDYMGETLLALTWDSPSCRSLLELCLSRWQGEGRLPGSNELMNHPDPGIATMAVRWYTEGPQVSPNWDIMHDIPVALPADNLKKEIETTFDRLLLKKVLRHSRLKQAELKEIQHSPEGQDHPSIPSILREILELKEVERRITSRNGMVITH